MGACAIMPRLVPPPPVGETITAAAVNDLIFATTKCTQIILWDSTYSLIHLFDLQNFSMTVNGNNNPYRAESADCDDFAITFLGKVRDWYGQVTSGGGVCVGLLAGDLRLNATDPYRGHAVNIYIDENKKVMFFDPMWNSYNVFQPWMTATTVLM
jgi:hypothetical protein